jgi:hypothetical protein
MSNNLTIKCPNCHHAFPIGNALAQEIEADIRGKYLKRYSDDQQKLEEEKKKLAREMEELKLKGENQDQLLADKLKLAKQQLQEELTKKAGAEVQAQMEVMREELDKKSKLLVETQKRELLILQREQQMKEKEEQLKIEMEKQFLEKQKEIEDKVRKIESERTDLKVKELEKKLADQVELAETMRRKAEQGSMQLQGEVQELALEELLRATFPFDSIDEVAKGVKGADCVQTVRNTMAQACGKVIYESKRTKAFAGDWIEKLKSDMRAQQADIAVIVTEVLPKEMESFGFKDGVWICRFSDVKALAYMLRDSLIRIHSALATQENKGDKMQLLYNYLTANEFRQNIEAVVEGFLSLKDSISRERIQMEKIWKEREKQLEKVLLNTTQFYGSIKGIAGNAVADLKMLPE